MREFNTKYGLLKGIVSYKTYTNGMLKECMVNEYNQLVTLYGILIPQYENGGARRKYINSVTFYENGSLKSISLNTQTKILSPIGLLPAEHVTFYESGHIKRLFPLNGKITAYWTEEEEYGLTDEFAFKFPFGSFKSRVIGIYFYGCGAVKSLTFWPQSPVEVQAPLGKILVRTGISFYPTGEIKSLEPQSPTAVKTPIGDILAYDASAIGVHGDVNSLTFDEYGNIRSLVTSTDYITVTSSGERNATYGPGLKTSLLESSKKEIQPVAISFNDDGVCFDDNYQSEYTIKEYTFKIQSFPELLNLACGDCSDCSACGADKYEL